MARGDDNYNISASQVKAHSKCPKQWWFRYRSDKDPTKKEEGYLALGSRVHEAIEDALTAESPPPLGHMEAVKAAIQNLYADKDEYPLSKEFYSDGMKYCAKAAEYIAKQDPDIRGIEVRHEYQINTPELQTGVTAIMDVVTDGEIWDWKTGRVRDDTPHEEKIQGAIYMAAYYDKYGEEPDAIKFVYLKEGKVRSIEVGDDIWKYMKARAVKLVRAKEADEFPGNPGDACYWCGYEFWCDAAPAGVGGVPFDEY